MTDLNLITYLKDFITEERWHKFQAILEQRTRHISFVIENVYQPHNASAVVRSCDCFGIQDLHIIENRNNYKTDKNIALGAGKWVSIKKYNEENATSLCLTQLKSKGYAIVATTPHTNDFTSETLPLDKPVAVVFGTEKEGITDEVRSHADYFYKIPMMGFTESLNISVAAAITAQNLSTRLRNSTENWALSEKEKQEIMLEWLKNSIKSSARIIDDYYKSDLGKNLA